MRETFSLQTILSPDYGIGANWSDGLVPGPGTLAEINNATVLVDPETVLRASILLQGAATLSGNGGGFALGADELLAAHGENAVFADGAFVNDGGIALLGCETALTIIVDNASGVAESYGLAVPSFENAGGIVVAGGATLALAGTETF